MQGSIKDFDYQDGAEDTSCQCECLSKNWYCKKNEQPAISMPTNNWTITPLIEMT